MEDIVIEFEIDDATLISVNDQYIHPVRKSNNGRYYSYFAPSYELTEMQEFYRNKLKEVISEEQVAELQKQVQEKTSGLSVEIIIGVPPESYRRKKTFWNIDASNYIKAFEDCLANFLGIDDSMNYKISCEKQIYEMTEDVKYKWIVYAKIAPYNCKGYLNKVMEELL